MCQPPLLFWHNSWFRLLYMTNGSVANGEKVNPVIRALSFLLRRRRFTVSFLAVVYYVKLLCNGRAFIAYSYWVEITFWRQCRMQLLLQYVQEFLLPCKIEEMISLIRHNLKFSICETLGKLSHNSVLCVVHA